MATVTLTSFYADLQNWPGTLFEAYDGATVLTKTATNFTFRYPATHEHANFRVLVQGTGFAYDGNVPLDGNMTLVRVYDALGNIVITFSNLQSNPFGADLSQFYASVFGSRTPDGNGPGPDGKIAWNHLMSGNDVINGTSSGDRHLVGLDYGNDTYNMGAGDDRVYGGMGNDTLIGGDGFDDLTYRETAFNEGGPAFRGATFNIDQNRVLDPWGGTDVISGFEFYEGSRFNDVYNGSAGLRDRFSGLRGRDTIDGGDVSFDSLGNATDDRRDEVRYDEDYWTGGVRGILVNLETSFVNGSITGTVRDGFGNLDTLIDIERVSGTRYNDTFVGSRANNNFWGGEGRDSFNGGDGFDTLRMDRNFVDTPVGNVRVDLSRATNQILDDGFGNVETAINMEGIISGEGNDSLKGNAADNYFEGNRGADTMTGGGGADYFFWFEQGSFGQGDRITDFSRNDDVLQFETANFNNMTTTLTLVNGAAATQAGVGTFVFNTVTDILFWDADGAGGAAAIAVVQLNNITTLTAANFDLF